MNHTLCVSYDIPEDSDYSSLIEQMKSYPAWWHSLESTWLIRTNKSCRVVRDELKNLIPNGGGLIVFKVGDDWSTYRIPSAGTEWLQRNWDEMK